MLYARLTGATERRSALLRRLGLLVGVCGVLGVALLVLGYRPTAPRRVYRLDGNAVNRVVLFNASSCLDVLRVNVPNDTDILVFRWDGGAAPPYDQVNVAQWRTYGGTAGAVAHCASAACIACMAEYTANASDAPPAAYTYTQAPAVIVVTRPAWDAAPRTRWALLAQRNDSLCHACHAVERMWERLFTARWPASLPPP